MGWFSDIIGTTISPIKNLVEVVANPGEAIKKPFQTLGTLATFGMATGPAGGTAAGALSNTVSAALTPAPIPTTNEAPPVMPTASSPDVKAAGDAAAMAQANKKGRASTLFGGGALFDSGYTAGTGGLLSFNESRLNNQPQGVARTLLGV